MVTTEEYILLTSFGVATCTKKAKIVNQSVIMSQTKNINHKQHTNCIVGSCCSRNQVFCLSNDFHTTICIHKKATQLKHYWRQMQETNYACSKLIPKILVSIMTCAFPMHQISRSSEA